MKHFVSDYQSLKYVISEACVHVRFCISCALVRCNTIAPLSCLVQARRYPTPSTRAKLTSLRHGQEGAGRPQGAEEGTSA